MTQTATHKKYQRKVIEIYGLIKIYKRKEIETSALRGLSCKIEKGQITVLMGPSGCGKTTLLNIISGISHPSAGAVVVESVDISEYTEKQLEDYRREKISYIFQQMNLIPTMKVIDNITFALEYTNRYDEQSKERVKEIVKFIGIDNKLKHYPDELSGGEQQRVALAAAIAKDSSFILCDEPTGELDSAAKLKVMEILKMIIKKYPEKTIIVVSHDPDFKMIADRVLYMRDGKISYEESVEKLKQLQAGGLNEGGIDSISALRQPSNADAMRELKELAKTISDRLESLEEQETQRKSLKLDEKI
jgi:putative ABC transport system ATP-binding protein